MVGPGYITQDRAARPSTPAVRVGNSWLLCQVMRPVPTLDRKKSSLEVDDATASHLVASWESLMTRKWHYVDEANRSAVEVTEAELHSLLRAGTLTAESQVWADHLPGWCLAKDVSSLEASVSSAPLWGQSLSNRSLLAKKGGKKGTTRFKDEMWFYVGADQQQVPSTGSDGLPLAKLLNLLASGEIDQDTRVWKPGMASWLAMRDVPDLAEAAHEDNERKQKAASKEAREASKLRADEERMGELKDLAIDGLSIRTCQGLTLTPVSADSDKPTSLQIDGPQKLIDALRSFGYDDSQLQLSISPFDPINLPPLDRGMANIPTLARTFAFVYPLPPLRHATSAQREVLHYISCCVDLLLYGGYIYLEDHDKASYNAIIGQDSPADARRGRARARGDLVQTTFHFVGPFALPAQVQEQLTDAQRFQPTTLRTLSDAGAVDFAWLRPAEFDAVEGAYGAFAYRSVAGCGCYFRLVPVSAPERIARTVDFSDLCGGARCFRIARTEERGMQPTQLKKIFAHIERRLLTVGESYWRQLSGARQQPLMNPKDVTLYACNDYVIKPATCAERCSLVEFMATSQQLPKWFVSHWWGETIASFMACIHAHAKDRKQQGFDTSAYWICAYANNQWDLADDMAIDPAQSSFRRAISQCEGTLSVVDHSGVIFSRIWCVYESYTTLVAMDDGAEDNYKWDIYASTSSGIAADGMMDGVVTAGRSLFPVERAIQSLDITVETANASLAADRTRILNAIVGASNLAAAPPLVHPEFDHLNGMIRARFSSGLLRKALGDAHVEYNVVCRFFDTLASGHMRGTLVLNLEDCEGLTAEVAKLAAASLPKDLRSLDVRIFPYATAFLHRLQETHCRNVPPNLLLSMSRLTIDDAKLVSQMLTTSCMSHVASIALDGSVLPVDKLKGMAPVREIDLSGLKLGDGSAVLIGDMIKENATLTMLDIRNNTAISEVGFRWIGEALLHSTASKLAFMKCDVFRISEDTTELIYDECMARGQLAWTPAIAILLAGSLRMNSTLTTMKLSSSVGVEGAQALATMLESNDTIGNVSLDVVDVSVLPVQELRGALQAGTGREAQCVDLSDRGLGSLAAIIMSRLMRSNATTTTLDLRHNAIGSDGGVAIAGMLNSNITLEWLNLARNCLGTVGSIAIAEALQVNSTLTFLNLQDNALPKREVGNAFARALETNTTLLTLNLAELQAGSTDPEFVYAIFKGLTLNITLTNLSLDAACLGNKVQDAIAAAQQSRIRRHTLQIDAGVPLS